MAGKRRLKKKYLISFILAGVIIVLLGTVALVNVITDKPENKKAKVEVNESSVVLDRYTGMTSSVQQAATSADGTDISGIYSAAEGTVSGESGVAEQPVQGSLPSDSSQGQNSAGQNNQNSQSGQNNQNQNNQNQNNQNQNNQNQNNQNQNNQNQNNQNQNNQNQNNQGSQNQGTQPGQTGSSGGGSGITAPTGGNGGYDSTNISDVLQSEGFDTQTLNVYAYEQNGQYYGQIVTQSNATIIYIKQRSPEFDAKVKSVIQSMMPNGASQVWNEYQNATSDKTFVTDNKKVRIVTADGSSHSQIVIYN